MKIALPAAFFALSLWGSAYDQQEMQGWQLHIEHQFYRDHPDLLKAVLAELHHQLYQIIRAVPEPALRRLREVPIWIHYKAKTECMAYHPNVQWLRAHNYNPDMAHAIEIGNGETFLKWTHDQPWMVLHELAHAYHHQVSGFDEPRIREAYQAMKKSGAYDSVLRIQGRRDKHYALNDEQEYFAESSEAYFGTNDFYPFVSAELKEADPRMYDLLKSLWQIQ